MSKKEIYRNLLFITGLQLDSHLLQKIFKLGGADLSLSALKRLQTADDKDNAKPLTDDLLKAFIDGLYEYRNAQTTQGIKTFNFDLYAKETG